MYSRGKLLVQKALDAVTNDKFDNNKNSQDVCKPNNFETKADILNEADRGSDGNVRDSILDINLNFPIENVVLDPTIPNNNADQRENTRKKKSRNRKRNSDMWKRRHVALCYFKSAFNLQRKDKNEALTKSNVCYITMDLQQMQPLPKISTSKAFYLRQLSFYNLFIDL
ncbi:hypothetical protein ABEB36_009474 [Hypothenemus hampei]|uniref:Uncharacterized protein n=1 Tax=Hypothenemus hampei TaxID=57062 RepID=A0ABD1EGG5_HYPHA